ncbi:MAG: response regulator transcription factor [Lachnospiraceae bacterium]|nr:response regulator transcription factor [Lachnospiraceae bacterium]
MKILLAEDEKDLREVVSEFLEISGNTVFAVENGKLALEESRKNPYEVIVLDIMMPEMDGITALTKMRAEGNVTPVLMLTAKSEIDDKIAGLDAGADDYLAKPFSMKELLARLQAMTRRKEIYRKSVLSAGNTELNTKTGTLSAVNSISLSTDEVKLLELFMLNQGKPYSKEELFQQVWAEDNEAEISVVEVYISFLTGKLDAVGADIQILNDEKGIRIS